MVLEQFKQGSALALKIKKLEEFLGMDEDSLEKLTPEEFDKRLGEVAFQGGTLGLGTKVKAAGKGGKVIKKILDKNAQRVIDRLHARIGGSRKNIEKKIGDRLERLEFKKALDELTPKKMSNLRKWVIGGTIVGGAGTLMTTDTMMNWAMLDTVLGIRTMLYRDLAESVKWGETEAQDAQDIISEMDQYGEIAQDKINVSTKTNPLTMIFAKAWKVGQDVTDLTANTYKEFISDKLGEEAEAEAEEEKMRTFRGVEKTESESLIQEQSFMRAEEAQEQKKRQAELDIKREEAEGRSKQQAKMRSQVGVGALARGPPPEQKKREVPSKIKFGL